MIVITAGPQGSQIQTSQPAGVHDSHLHIPHFHDSHLHGHVSLLGRVVGVHLEAEHVAHDRGGRRTAGEVAEGVCAEVLILEHFGLREGEASCWPVLK